MTDKEILEPISAQIQYWIAYSENKSDGYINSADYQKFKSVFEMDCNLTDGNVNADMLFSLFIPFRRVLTHLNKGLPKVEKNIPFLSVILASLPMHLPPDNPLVQELSILMSLGRTRANVMILPDCEMNSLRGAPPYWDYVPYFLHECFRDGDFSGFFDSDEHLEEWIRREHLQMIFDGDISKDRIRDLVGSGSVKDNRTFGPEKISQMLTAYAEILRQRSAFYPDK